jgi:TRAP-type C4-dicarboxylate transport system substrate-binding protein
LQWFTRVQYINKLPINYTLGALLVDAKSFSQLAPDHQVLLRQIAAKEMRALSLTTRRENEEAIQVMLANGLQQVEASAQELQTFTNLVDQTRGKLVGTAFSQQAHDRVNQLLLEYRQKVSTPKK